MNDTDILHEVRSMLKNVYPNGDEPMFEVNAITVNILHEMLMKLRTKRELSLKLAQYYIHRAHDISIKAQELEKSLENAHISLDNLPTEYGKALKSLADVACVLDLAEPTYTNLNLAMSNLTQAISTATDTKNDLLLQQMRLTEKFNKILARLNSLEKDVSSSKENNEAQCAEMNKNKVNDAFVRSKMEEYKRKMKNAEKTLALSGFEESLSHSVLVKEHEEVLKLEEELSAINAKLNSYYNLPPNEDLAKLKLEEAKQQLFNLQKEIQDKID